MFSEIMKILLMKFGNLEYTVIESCLFLGYYCLNGIKVFIEFFCFSGIYNNDIGLRVEFECFFCLGGYYCLFVIINFYLLCGAGYYCRIGVKTVVFM